MAQIPSGTIKVEISIEDIIVGTTSGRKFVKLHGPLLRIINSNHLDQITWSHHNYFDIPLTSFETQNIKFTVFCESNENSIILGTARNDPNLIASLWANINRSNSSHLLNKIKQKKSYTTSSFTSRS